MTGLAILAGVFALYAFFAGRLERWWITAPMVFVVAGALLGPSSLDLVHMGFGSESVTVIAELTLAVLLFADASTVALRDVEADVSVPLKLLLVGLPLTMVAGTVVARMVFPSEGWAAAALIAVILAPTDAALGVPVFTDRSVPVRVRRALNVESGLNDGLATPFLTLFLALVVAEQGTGASDWLASALGDVALAAVAACVVGLGGGRIMRWATDRGWTTATSSDLAVVALSFLSYSLAVAIGGNGFVAAFLAGLLFGRMTRDTLAEAIDFTERTGLFASFVVWVIFGALFAAPVLRGSLDPAAVAYAALSLTVIRMVPVAVALSGTGFRRVTVAFMGWFGPRGLASVVFTLIAVEALRDHAPVAHHLLEVATWTILLSVFAHGISARPLASAYGDRISRRAGAPELLAHPEPRVRRSL
ncbi:MAG: cation:proton antiporter [Actinomycetota bacterium]